MILYCMHQAYVYVYVFGLFELDEMTKTRLMSPTLCVINTGKGVAATRGSVLTWVGDYLGSPLVSWTRLLASNTSGHSKSVCFLLFPDLMLRREPTGCLFH